MMDGEKETGLTDSLVDGFNKKNLYVITMEGYYQRLILKTEYFMEIAVCWFLHKFSCVH